MTSSTSSSERAHSRSSVATRLRRAALGLFLASLTVMGAMELTLRSFDDFGLNGPDRIRLEMDHSDPRVGYHVGDPWGPREYSTVLHFNREGFRGAEFDRDPARSERVLLLGDSYVLAAQLDEDETLVAQAESLLADTDVLAMATAGSFLPDQLQVLRTRVPQLFGPRGRYPRVDALVIGVRLWGLLNHAAQGESADWRRRLKSPLSRRLEGVALRGIASPSHALSYLSSRAYAWLLADARRLDAPIDRASLERSARWMQSEVLDPLVQEAHRQGLPLAFVYFPSIAEVDGTAPELHRIAHAEIVGRLRQTGAVVVDATEDFHGDVGFFFPYDRHPNAAGHRVLGRALARAIAGLRTSTSRP